MAEELPSFPAKVIFLLSFVVSFISNIFRVFFISYRNLNSVIGEELESLLGLEFFILLAGGVFLLFPA